MNKMTIREIYKCNYIEDDGKSYPLQKWYNRLIDKNISEINIEDVLKMIRQKEFIELAILKAIEFLKRDPLVGELYEGELLKKLYTIDEINLHDHYNDIQLILSKAIIHSNNYKWLCTEEKEEFNDLINKFMDKINNK